MRIKKPRPMTHQEQMARTGRRKIEHSQASSSGRSGRPQTSWHAWVVAKAKKEKLTYVGHITREEINMLFTYRM